MDAASREPEVCGDDATPLGAGVVVVTGARGSGKTTLVNRLVSAFLHDARRAGNAGSSRATETETLTRATPRSSAAARTADERVADEYADMCRTPEGRRAFAAVEAQRAGVLPLAPTTVNVVVRRAPPDAPHAARVTVTYRDEPEIHALVAKARLAHGLTRGPPPSPSSAPRRGGPPHDRPRHHLDSDAEGDSADAAAASPRPTLAPAEFARLAGVLGCLPTPRAVAHALSDRSKPYLPARYRDLLGSTREITVRAPRPNAAARAVRAVVHRLTSPTCARLGCVAGDVIVELPLDLDVVIVDTPGAPSDDPDPDRDPDRDPDPDRASSSFNEWSVPEAKARLIAALASAPMDILLGVFDGRPGPSRALRAALIESRAFDAMIRRRDGGSLALAWSLDGPILSSRRAFQTQRDVAAFADEQIKAIEDGAERRRTGSTSRGGDPVPRTTWCGLLTRAIERNAGEVAGAHANRAVFTHFGSWRRDADADGDGGGDGDGLGHPFERLAAHVAERVEEAREIRRRARDDSSRAATPDPEPAPEPEPAEREPAKTARNVVAEKVKGKGKGKGKGKERSSPVVAVVSNASERPDRVSTGSKSTSKPRAVSEGVSAGVPERKRRATAPPDAATERDRDREPGPAAVEARDGSPPRETASIPRVRDADAPPATAFTDAYAYVSPEKEPPPTIRRPSVPPGRRARRVRFADDVAREAPGIQAPGYQAPRFQAPGSAPGSAPGLAPVSVPPRRRKPLLDISRVRGNGGTGASRAREKPPPPREKIRLTLPPAPEERERR